jgi:hypothetical protein
VGARATASAASTTARTLLFAPQAPRDKALAPASEHLTSSRLQDFRATRFRSPLTSPVFQELA